MARLLAPWARTMSTVRLVSVVVPDWLMATTRVFSMVVASSPAQADAEPGKLGRFLGTNVHGFTPQVMGEKIRTPLGCNAGCFPGR